jgi:hypothetical protein
MNKTEIIESLNKIYLNSKVNHNILTPLQLCNEMINSINHLDGDILVISNLEFLIILKQKNVNLSNLYYATDCELKKKVAITLGININNIVKLQYNKEVEIDIDMKFDIVIQNPPYNPNALWKKFVEKGINMLKDDGQMVAIHPDSWRNSSKHNKLCLHLKQHISKLYITDFNSFPGIGISTDWYLYNKKIQHICNINYTNKDIENIKLSVNKRILRFSTNSIAGNIISKICTKENNGAILLNGFDAINNPHYDDGIYNQCGGLEGCNTEWVNGIFCKTHKPSKHQFEDKVVMCYARKPRAKFFSKNDKIGVFRAYYWLTNNQSLPILLNSKLLWKIGIELTSSNNNKKNKSVRGFERWFLQSLNFDDLNVQTEEELYKHYKLTEEEINWIKE